MSNVPSTQYMVRDASGSVYGPADIGTLRQWIMEHRVLGSMMIAPQGSNDWQLVSSHPQLADLANDPVAGTATTTPAGAPAATGSSMSPTNGVNPYAATCQPSYQSATSTGSVHPLAIASLVTGILSIISGCCLCIGGVPGAAAVIMGVLALQKMKQDPMAGGRGLAIAGIITGSIGLLFALIFIVISLIRFLLAAAPHRAF